MWMRAITGTALVGAALLVWGGVAVARSVRPLSEEEAGAREPVGYVVRKCKPPEKGWCVLAMDRLDGPLPEACECGPMPAEYASLLEPDRSWETVKAYRKQLRREARKAR